MDIEINGTQNEILRLVNFRVDDNYYYTSSLRLVSRGFSLERDFYFTLDYLSDCLDKFKNYLEANKEFECILRGMHDGSEWIKFSREDEKGHIRIQAHFEEHSSFPQNLDICFLIDQITLVEIKKRFENLSILNQK